MTEDGRWLNAVAVARPEGCPDDAWRALKSHDLAQLAEPGQFSVLNILDEDHCDECWADEDAACLPHSNSAVAPRVARDIVELMLAYPSEWLGIQGEAHGSPDVRREFEDLYGTPR